VGFPVNHQGGDGWRWPQTRRVAADAGVNSPDGTEGDEVDATGPDLCLGC
jgi:hypothetical protein